jgi:hypothetical protein
MSDDPAHDEGPRGAAAAESRSPILAHDRAREITNNVILAALFVLCAGAAAHLSSCGDDEAGGASQESLPLP